MSCCNNVKISKQDELGCQCVFKCSTEPGARVLSAEVTLAAAPTGADAEMPTALPVYTMDGEEYLPLDAAHLVHGSALGYGIVSCGFNVDDSTVYPYAFQPEVTTKGSFWSENVFWPAGFTDADKKQMLTVFRAHGLVGVSFYAPYAA